jgi:3-dehydroquinate synthase
MAETVEVKTRFGKYSVVIGSGLDYGKLALDVKKPCKVVIVSDDNVFPLYGDAAIGSFRESGYQTGSYVLKNGEASKNLTTVAELLNFLANEKVTRGDMLVALGGGVVGDITGFVSAIYLRGVDYIQIPTTILAAVDSSVGGKTGVDLSAGKNLAGAFHQPIIVLCDTGVFATLPKAVYADGMAEVIKHGMIADREMLVSLDSITAIEMCRRNVAIKTGLVEQDEFDTGVRRLLNFGHTVGHAVEAVSNYRVSHGSAVAVGMTVITRAGEKSAMTDSACLGDLVKALECYGLPTRCDFSAKELAEAALHDKKRSGGTVTLVIPRKAGQAELYDIPVEGLEGFIAKGLEE